MVLWNERPGTIFDGESRPLGSSVYLDGETIVKIKADLCQPYILIAEPFAQDDRCIVFTTPSPLLRLWQTCDIIGTTSLTAWGDFAIQNARVLGYGDPETGQLIYHAVIKGPFSPTPWSPMLDLTVTDTTEAAPAANPPNEPNDNLPPPPQFHQTVASVLDASALTGSAQSVRIQDDFPSPPGGTQLPGSLVEFECKQITSVGSEVIDGSSYNYLDVSDDSPGTGTIRALYTGALSSSLTDRINMITGQLGYPDSGSTPILCVDCGPSGCFDPQSLQGQVQIVHEQTIEWAKTFADGAALPASLTGLVVTTTSNDLPEALYVQSSDRRQGIRVLYSGSTTFNRGDVVSVSGTIDSGVDGERQIDSSGVTLTEGGNSAPGPLGLPNRGLGSGPFNAYTPGIDGAAGLNNIGLLIKTWGVCNGFDQAGDFYVDDGSAITDGSGLMGVMVSQWPGQPPIAPPMQGAYVTVAGISGCQNLGGNLVRTVRVRDENDVTYVAGPRRYYVNCTTGNDIAYSGTDWQHPFQTISHALQAAVSADEVWVAKGTYGQPINMTDGVALYGGFLGYVDWAHSGETFLDQRNWKTNETIIDGTNVNQQLGAVDIDSWRIRSRCGQCRRQLPPAIRLAVCRRR